MASSILGRMWLELRNVLRGSAVAEIERVLSSPVCSSGFRDQTLSIVKRLNSAIVSRWQLILESNLSLMSMWHIASYACRTQTLIEILRTVITISLSRILELVLHRRDLVLG